MSEQDSRQKDKQKEGFWASLSFTDYMELLVYIGLAAALVYEAINYFS